MTGRRVPEWVGRKPESKPPWSCVERLLEKAGHKCQGPCHQPVGPRNSYDVDHIIELKDWSGEGHGNRESNLQILCRKVCHKTKTRIRNIARNNEKRTRRHLAGYRSPKGRPMPGTKASKWKKTLRHGWVLRDEK